jgi:hypothetical protein
MTQFTFPGDLDHFTGNFIQNGNGIFIADDGSVGIGTQSPICPLHAANTITYSADGLLYGLLNSSTVTGTLSSGYAEISCGFLDLLFDGNLSDTGKPMAIGMTTYVRNSANSKAFQLNGLNFTVEHYASAVLPYVYGITGYFGCAAAGSVVTQAMGVYAGGGTYTDTSEITTAYGLYAEIGKWGPGTGGVIGSAYGVYIGDVQATAAWGLYQAYAAARNYFAGKVGIAINTPTASLDINSDTLRLRNAKTPASAGAAGNAGDICWDANYLYICVAADTWKRMSLSSW